MLSTLGSKEKREEGEIGKEVGTRKGGGPPFTDEGQIWWVGADLRSTFTRQFSSECVHCVGFRWPKNIILGRANFDIWGAPVPTPFYQ